MQSDTMLHPSASVLKRQAIRCASSVVIALTADCGGGQVIMDDAAHTADVSTRLDASTTDVTGATDVVTDIPDPPDASVDPAYLPNQRTYDQERDYIAWDGPVSYVNLTHRDNTSLPASEGGGSCTGGCTEQVTRIDAGGCVHGNFFDLCGFRIQFASEPGAGTAVVTACGQSVGSFAMAGSGTPGFNNFPAAGNWVPPTQGACEWRACATGAFVDFRAVTPTYCPAPAPPAVDLKVNGADGMIVLDDPATYTLTWTSTNAVSCVMSGSWIGGVMNAGARTFHAQPAMRYTYTIQCMNSLATVSDAVTVVVQHPPG